MNLSEFNDQLNAHSFVLKKAGWTREDKTSPSPRYSFVAVATSVEKKSIEFGYLQWVTYLVFSDTRLREMVEGRVFAGTLQQIAPKRKMAVSFSDFVSAQEDA